MDELVRDLTENFVVPVLAAYLGLAWKALAKDPALWEIEDRMLVGELILAAVFIELGFVVPPIYGYVVGRPLAPSEWHVLGWRSLLLLIVIGLLVVSARLVRWCTAHHVLTVSGAELFTAAGVFVLALLMLSNNLITVAVNIEARPG